MFNDFHKLFDSFIKLIVIILTVFINKLFKQLVYIRAKYSSWLSSSSICLDEILALNVVFNEIVPIHATYRRILIFTWSLGNCFYCDWRKIHFMLCVIKIFAMTNWIWLIAHFKDSRHLYRCKELFWGSYTSRTALTHPPNRKHLRVHSYAELWNM